MDAFDTSISASIYGQLLRDLNRLHTEVESYSDESHLWKLSGSIKNSAGSLTLHIVGNLRHFIGHVLGGTEFKRNRDAEFENKTIARSKLLSLIELTKIELDHTFRELNDEVLSGVYPLKIMDKQWTNGSFLIHLLGHLNYHLGQINYHRRILDHQ